MARTAAESFAAGMTLMELKAEYQRAINTRNGQMQHWMSDALVIKERGAGPLRAIVEPPSRENGGRWITRYEGDPMEWMAPFVSPGAVCKIDRDLAIEADRAAERAEARER